MTTALVFPGQGSQRVAMGQELAARFPLARRTYEEADDALGFSISKICFEGPEEDLRRTANTQPAILAHSIAVLATLRARHPAALDGVAAAAGHSLGEYSAGVAAGALAFADAVRIVHERGTFMQEAVPEGVGAMAAVLGLAPDAIAAASELCRQRGARKVMPLPVSAPFHCALMQPAADRLRPLLDALGVSDPRVPVVTNVDASPAANSGEIRTALARQVVSAVRWVESVERMAAMGVTSALELGPGAVLAGLVKRTRKEIPVTSIGKAEDLSKLGEGAR